MENAPAIRVQETGRENPDLERLFRDDRRAAYKNYFVERRREPHGPFVRGRHRGVRLE